VAVRKTPAVLGEFLTDRAALVVREIGESVVLEVRVHCTVVEVAVAVTSAVAVAALTKIGAAPMPAAVAVDLHTPIQRS
jgi:hypothetical protein